MPIKGDEYHQMNFDLKQDVKTINDFKEIIKNIQETYRINNDIIVECDKAMGDVRHYCELSYPTKRTDKTKVCKLMHDYSVKRREAKDTISAIEPLVNLLKANKDFLSKFNQAINEMNKNTKRIESDKIYTPRVLTKLFPKK